MLGWRQRSLQAPLPAAGCSSTHKSVPHNGADAAASGTSQGSELWLEPQAGVYLVVNENAPNMVPCVPVVLGAGGCAVDFEGQPLLGRRLAAGRLSVAYAGNEQLLGQVMALVAIAQQGAPARV
jgi:hypothetical protein